MWIIAHRGASGTAPENTMAGFDRAVELGARFIETDLQLTRDGQVVAIHDSTVNRTTNGNGEIHSLTFAEVRALDAGAWFPSAAGESFAGECVPSLDEILQFAKEHDVIFYLEIKSGSARGIEHAVVAALRASGDAARAVIISFDPATLGAVHRLDRNVMTGYLCDRAADDLVERSVQIGASQIVPHAKLVTPALVEQAHRAGLHVVAWTVNEPEDMRRLMAAGIDGLMSDYPDRLVSLPEGS